MFRGMHSHSNALTASYPKISYSWIDYSNSYPLEKREAITTAIRKKTNVVRKQTIMAPTRSQSTNNNTRQRRRTEMNLLTIVVAALFAVSYTSAFNILQSPSTTPVRIEQQQRQQYTSPAVAATAPVRSRATTLLPTSPLDSQEDETAVSSSSFGKRLHSWKCWIQFWNTETFQNFTKRRQARAVAASLLSAGSIASVLGGAPAPAYARTLQDTLEEGTQIYSLRPGVSRAQAEQLTSGVMPDEVRDNVDSKTAIGATTGLSKEESAAKAKQKDTLYGDYDDYDDEDYAADEEEFGESAYGNTVTKARQKSFSSDTDTSNSISKGTKQTFTGISSDSSKTKPMALYAKVSLACFVPTFGLFGVRDFIRTRTEEKNVKKAIEIVDAQRAEYFGVDKDGNNITATEESDGDIEDELKDLKDGEDDDDEDDDDDDEDDEDDDEDEEDEPPRRRRSLPKPPKGPSGSGGFEGFDDDDDDGPSDEDIARLGDIFNKS